MSRADFSGIKRIVLKVGSSLLADPIHGINMQMVQRLALDIQHLQSRGIEVCLVSSGAVALGRVQLGWVGKNLSVHEKQAAAAVGQPMLMHAYKQAFSELGVVVAQMLLTKDDLRHRRRYLNASNTSHTLFKAKVVPIVNENDTVVVEEIKFGDNDSLGALVSTVVKADLMVMMTDVDGLFDVNPVEDKHAKRISEVVKLTAEVFAMAGDVGSSFGTGGMLSKLHAAKIATHSGVTAAVINGAKATTLMQLLAGDDVGTVFHCGEDRHSLHEHAISNLLHVAGQLHVAEQARASLISHKRLEPQYVESLQGDFDKGDCLEVWSGQQLLAKGLSNYSKAELEQLLGCLPSEIEGRLGYVDFHSVMLPENLVVMDQ